MNTISLSPSEILHCNWHVMGTRKVDGLIQLLASIPTPLDIIVDDIGWVNTFKNKLHVHSVEFSPEYIAEPNRHIYIKRAFTPEHAEELQANVPEGSNVYTLCEYNKNLDPENGKRFKLLNTLHMNDGNLIGITRPVEV
ncbi:MAG: hypothetical protein NC548_11295 [Lachnospiraceae bacterium]|nr:hypothetical protein [Lachnospiraceae bacterium]